MGDMKFEGTPEEWDALVKKNKELHYQKQIMNPYSSDSQSYKAYEKGFIEGFEKAKSTLYTEEQMKLSFEYGRTLEPFDFFDDFILSLDQHKVTLYTEEQVREAMYKVRGMQYVTYSDDEIIESLNQPNN